MLFDLKGRRRRVVQVTYVGLAVLMGGGLVLSGIGSDASGGLLDALVGGGGSSSSSDAKKPFQNQIKAADLKLRANPNDGAALTTLVRAHFGLAGLEQTENNGQVGYSGKGVAELRTAERAWGRYIATNPDKIDTGIAATALALYGILGPPDAKNRERYIRPAQEIAAQTNTPDGYITLVEVATKAGDTRTAALAERKALSLAQTKDEKTTVKNRIAEVKATAASKAPQPGTTTP
jgi:hypothetical protein